MADVKCGGKSHAECPGHEPHTEWCYEDGSQCIDKDCRCHKLWAVQEGWADPSILDEPVSGVVHLEVSGCRVIGDSSW